LSSTATPAIPAPRPPLYWAPSASMPLTSSTV
jgi:hypothetical protein